jgi:signal transduction histidine kinase
MRVLVNLVTNAVESMYEGGELEVVANGNSENVRIVVEDRGCGYC